MPVFDQDPDDGTGAPGGSPSQPIITYDLLGMDPEGHAVYQGSDGQMYTDGQGPNGFVPYTGPGLGPDRSTATPPAPTGTPPAGPSGGGGGGNAGGGGGAAPAPQGQGPTFTPPGYTPPPAFDYADFVAPNPGDLDSDPAYKYAMKSEQDAIQKSAAARGILNTGGTINDLLLNAKDVNSSFFNDLYNRKAGEYMMGRQGAVDKYNINYGTQFRDPYQMKYQGASDAYNSQIHNYDLNRQYNWYQTLFDWQKDQDNFDRKYKLLGI